MGFRDQAGWNALLHRERAKKELTIEAFTRGEVHFPGYLDPKYQSYSKAALTHNILTDTREKIEFTFGLSMRTFFCNPTGLFFLHAGDVGPLSAENTAEWLSGER